VTSDQRNLAIRLLLEGVPMRTYEGGRVKRKGLIRNRQKEKRWRHYLRKGGGGDNRVAWRRGKRRRKRKEKKEESPGRTKERGKQAGPTAPRPEGEKEIKKGMNPKQAPGEGVNPNII